MWPMRSPPDLDIQLNKALLFSSKIIVKQQIETLIESQSKNWNRKIKYMSNWKYVLIETDGRGMYRGRGIYRGRGTYRGGGIHRGRGIYLQQVLKQGTSLGINWNALASQILGFSIILLENSTMMGVCRESR